MSAAPRSISVLMPTYQGAARLGSVLDRLAAQRVDVPWDFLAVDSGSTDGTLDLFRERARSFPVPLRVQGIELCEFNHGDTRNLMAALSEGELLVYITDDAVPVGDDWLATLARNFDDPSVGGAYCRNVPRPEADVLARVLSEHDYSYRSGRRETRLPPAEVYARMGPEELRELYNYCDTASALRRELWERHPYPRCEGAEDVVLARALLEAGCTIVYDDAACVLHSHEYDAEQGAQRARIDGRINAEWLGRVAVGSARDARSLAWTQLKRDRQVLIAEGCRGWALLRELRRAWGLRRPFYKALFEGGQSTYRKPRTRMLARAELDVLYVALPEGDSVGRGMALELERRGHRCAIVEKHEDAASRLAVDAPQVLVVAGGQAEQVGLIQAARRGGVTTVIACGAAPDPVALALADLVVCTDAGLYEQLLASGEHHPDALAPSLGADPSAQALEWEYRLRAAVCLRTRACDESGAVR